MGIFKNIGATKDQMIMNWLKENDFFEYAKTTPDLKYLTYMDQKIINTDYLKIINPKKFNTGVDFIVMMPGSNMGIVHHEKMISIYDDIPEYIVFNRIASMAFIGGDDVIDISKNVYHHGDKQWGHINYISIDNMTVRDLVGICESPVKAHEIELTDCNQLKDLRGLSNITSDSISIKECLGLESLLGGPKLAYDLLNSICIIDCPLLDLRDGAFVDMLPADRCVHGITIDDNVLYGVGDPYTDLLPEDFTCENFHVILNLTNDSNIQPDTLMEILDKIPYKSLAKQGTDVYIDIKTSTSFQAIYGDARELVLKKYFNIDYNDCEQRMSTGHINLQAPSTVIEHVTPFKFRGCSIRV